MRKYLIFFISAMIIIFMGCSKRNDGTKPVVLSNHPAKPVILKGNYNQYTDHGKEKKLIRKKIKKLDTVINTQFDHVKDWVSNVGEAIDMME